MYCGSVDLLIHWRRKEASPWLICFCSLRRRCAGLNLISHCRTGLLGCRSHRPAEPALLRLLGRDFEPLARPDGFNPLVVHHHPAVERRSSAILR